MTILAPLEAALFTRPLYLGSEREVVGLERFFLPVIRLEERPQFLVPVGQHLEVEQAVGIHAATRA